MRRLGPPLLAAVLAVATAPVAAQPRAEPVAAQPQAEPFAGIRRLLELRADAVLAGDRQAFLRTIATDATRGFVQRQRLLFEGFRTLGLDEYRLELTDRYWPELTTSREVARYGAGVDPTVLHVEERYRLRGFDDEPALEDLYLTFVRQGGGWRIASDSDLSDLALYSGRKLWEFGPIVTRRSEHFLYVSHQELRSAGPAILRATEAALEDLDEAWPVPWSRRVILFAPSTTDQLRRILQATFDLDVFVAFAYSSVDRREDYDLGGHRVIFNWENFSRYSYEVQQSILVHELLHVATREVSGPMVPAFVDEGIAEWVSDGDTDQLGPVVASGTFDRRLPRDYEFITGSDQDILLSYDESFSAADYAVQRYGIDAVARMYRLVGEVRLEPGTPPFHVSRAMQQAFGVELDAFQHGWAAWVAETL